jgi:hypothetical protein
MPRSAILSVPAATAALVAPPNPLPPLPPLLDQPPLCIPALPFHIHLQPRQVLQHPIHRLRQVAFSCMQNKSIIVRMSTI